MNDFNIPLYDRHTRGPLMQISKRLQFTIDAECDGSAARATTFTTAHSTVQTPLFMPVATCGALRNQTLETVRDIGYPVLLANTYHLMLRPGAQFFADYGGLHRFMQWNGSILTDSGGFQIFSLAKSFTLKDEGAYVKSYIDGSEFLLSPETCIAAQRAIGSDIMMVLDQCISSRAPKDECEIALERTARWAERSLSARGESAQSIFAIVQGGCFSDLRRRSAQQLTSLAFDGFAIGGLAVGESDEERKDTTELTAAQLPRELPRYLMGVGTPLDLLEAVHRGIDMCDCILPTSLAQQGAAWTSSGKLELRRGVYKHDESALDRACGCPTCATYSRAFLHHLVKCDEHFGAHLLSQHNLYFYKQLMQEMRSAVIGNRFPAYYREKKEAIGSEEREYPKKHPKGPKKPKNLTSHGNYELHKNAAGFFCIRDRATGEVMHSVNDPVREADDLYVQQLHPAEIFLSGGNVEYTVWDVGMGAASNAMALVFEAEKMIRDNGSIRPLHIVSFENDTDSLFLALKNAPLFTHVRHAAPRAILEKGKWQSADGLVNWHLLKGDFCTMMHSAQRPDAILYDMFSMRVAQDLWTYPHFKKVFELCSEKPAKLLTYSASTQVRSALLAAGFWVAKGAATGPKNDTTIAYSCREAVDTEASLLDREWLSRWERSSAQCAPEASAEECEKIRASVREHGQFTSNS